MKGIIDDVMYNTCKAKRLCKFFRNFSKGGFLVPEQKWSHQVVLYRARNGVFFEHNLTKKCLQAVEFEDAKAAIKKFAPAKYVKIYGGVADSSCSNKAGAAEQ